MNNEAMIYARPCSTDRNMIELVIDAPDIAYMELILSPSEVTKVIEQVNACIATIKAG